MEFQYFLTLTTKMEVAFFYDKMRIISHYGYIRTPIWKMRMVVGIGGRWFWRSVGLFYLRAKKKIVLGSRRNTEIFHVIKWVNKKSDFKLVS